MATKRDLDQFEERVGLRFEAVDLRFGALDHRMALLERRMEGFESSLRSYFLTLLTSQVAVGALLYNLLS